MLISRGVAGRWMLISHDKKTGYFGLQSVMKGQLFMNARAINGSSLWKTVFLI